METNFALNLVWYYDHYHFHYPLLLSLLSLLSLPLLQLIMLESTKIRECIQYDYFPITKHHNNKNNDCNNNSSNITIMWTNIASGIQSMLTSANSLLPKKLNFYGKKQKKMVLLGMDGAG